MKLSLVEIDPETFNLLVIDLIKVKRTGKRFKKWLLELESEEDRFGLRSSNMPIVDAALDDRLPLPYKDLTPLAREAMEGMIRPDYSEISAPFYTAIRGAHLAPPEIVHKNGKMYAWTYFEEKEDEEQQSAGEQAHVERAKRR
ncbi:hypothetical protein VARIO8X_130129 [Burkholderiales bacterium 8X]|nr:hypothetical protein VARIO8X_130129 [Burkholderiales bacterium 8X]